MPTTEVNSRCSCSICHPNHLLYTIVTVSSNSFLKNMPPYQFRRPPSWTQPHEEQKVFAQLEFNEDIESWRGGNVMGHPFLTSHYLLQWSNSYSFLILSSISYDSPPVFHQSLDSESHMLPWNSSGNCPYLPQSLFETFLHLFVLFFGFFWVFSHFQGWKAQKAEKGIRQVFFLKSQKSPSLG